MADTVDKATRSRIMRSIKSKDTGPELAMALALRCAGVRTFSRSNEGLPGRPDFVFRRAKLAVFVHGCFWHLCPRHYKAPAPDRVDWARKMDRNRRRDVRVRRQLRRMGWRTMVVWEHEVPARAARRVKRRLEERFLHVREVVDGAVDAAIASTRRETFKIEGRWA